MAAGATDAVDAFAEFALPRQPAVDRDQLARRFDELSRRCHPDAGGDTAAFARLTQARGLLESTARRLRHLFELLVPGGKMDGPLPASCLALFEKVGPALEAASAVRSEHQSAKSSLRRALMAGRLLEARENLENVAADLDRRLSEIEAALPAWDGGAEVVGRWAREAAFLENWQRQVRAALSGLTL